MLYLYLTLVVLVGTLVGINSIRFWSNTTMRRGVRFSKKGKPTMFDVRNLLMEGKKDLAIHVYCEIFNTNPIQAKKDVEELERSLKV